MTDDLGGWNNCHLFRIICCDVADVWARGFEFEAREVFVLVKVNATSRWYVVRLVVL